MESRRGCGVFQGKDWVAVTALVAAVAASGGVGCATVAYRVPGNEVQRLASLPPQMRGVGVRVVAETEPLTPSTERVIPPPTAPPPPPDAWPTDGTEDVVIAPAPPSGVVSDGPNANVNVYIDAEVPIVGPRPVRARPSYSGPAPVPARPAITGVAARGAGWRGAPVTPPAAGGGGGWRGAPVAAAVRPSPRPATFSHTSSSGGSSIHHGGGGGNSAAVVGGVIAVIGIVAIIAIAAESAEQAERARAFNGWVDVDPTHALLLHYRGNQERTVPLSDLRPRDTIGLEYGVLSADDGPIQPRPAPPRPTPPRPAPTPAPPPPAAAISAPPSPPPRAPPSPSAVPTS